MHAIANEAEACYLQYALTSPTGKKKGNIQKPSHKANFTSQPPWCRYWSRLSLLYLTPISTADIKPKNICSGRKTQ